MQVSWVQGEICWSNKYMVIPSLSYIYVLFDSKIKASCICFYLVLSFRAYWRHQLWHGLNIFFQSCICMTSEHHLFLPSVWQWNCRYMYVFQRLRSVASGIRTPDIPLTGRKLKPTVPRPRLYFKKLIFINNWIRWSCQEKMGFRNKHVKFLCLNTIFVSKFL